VAAALLARLEEGGLVTRDDTEIRPVDDGAGIDDRARQLAGQFETLRTQDSRRLDTIGEYAAAPGCRAAFLRGYFGEDEGESCGLCDTCQARPARSDGFFAPLAPSKRAEGVKRGRGRRRPRGEGAPRDQQPEQPKREGARRGRRRRRPRSNGADRSPRQEEPRAEAAQPTPQQVEANADGTKRARRGGRRGRRGGRRRRGRGASPNDSPAAPSS
jgi:hypothetical protein